MALKDLINWFTGDDSREPSQSDEAMPLDMSPRRTITDRKPDGILKSVQWRTTSAGQPDAAAEAFFADARREMDRMRDEFMADKGGFGQRLPSQLFASSGPKVDETAQAYCATIEVPGFAEKDIKIEARDTQLTVSAEQRSQHEEGDKNHRVTEQFVNRFERVVPFATAIDPSTIKSTFDNGVLRVTVQKKN
jgi:HSP20 family protein